MFKKYIYIGILTGMCLLVPRASFFYVEQIDGTKSATKSTGEIIDSSKTMDAFGDGIKLFIASSIYDVLLADTPELRQKGLGGRTSIGPNEVMFFYFTEDSKHSFWMKDMLFSIDIVWLDSNWRVIHIERNVSPDTYPRSFGPEIESRYVLEFKEGITSKLELQVGDIINMGSFISTAVKL